MTTEQFILSLLGIISMFSGIIGFFVKRLLDKLDKKFDKIDMSFNSGIKDLKGEINAFRIDLKDITNQFIGISEKVIRIEVNTEKNTKDVNVLFEKVGKLENMYASKNGTCGK